MSDLTTEQVLHIAALARLTLKEGEVETMTKELGSILEYIEVLHEVDTSATEPTAQVTGMTNALREDTVVPSDASADALLACSPLPVSEHQIHVPHAHG